MPSVTSANQNIAPLPAHWVASAPAPSHAQITAASPLSPARLDIPPREMRYMPMTRACPALVELTARAPCGLAQGEPDRAGDISSQPEADIAFVPDSRALALTTPAGVERLVQSHQAGAVNLHRYHRGPMGEPLDALQFWAMLPQMECEDPQVPGFLPAHRAYVDQMRETIGIIDTFKKAGLPVSGDISRPTGSALAYGLLFGDMTPVRLNALLETGASLFDPVPPAYADLGGPVCFNLLELIYRREQLAALRDTAFSCLSEKLQGGVGVFNYPEAHINRLLATGFRAGNAMLVTLALSAKHDFSQRSDHPENIGPLLDALSKNATPEMLRLISKLRAGSAEFETALATALAKALQPFEIGAPTLDENFALHWIEQVISHAALRDISPLLEGALASDDAAHNAELVNAVLLHLKGNKDYPRMQAVVRFLSDRAVSVRLCDALVLPDAWHDALKLAHRNGRSPASRQPLEPTSSSDVRLQLPDVSAFDVYGAVLDLSRRFPDQDVARQRADHVREDIAASLARSESGASLFRVVRMSCGVCGVCSTIVFTALAGGLSYRFDDSEDPGQRVKSLMSSAITTGSFMAGVTAGLLGIGWMMHSQSVRERAFYRNTQAWLNGVLNHEV